MAEERKTTEFSNAEKSGIETAAQPPKSIQVGGAAPAAAPARAEKVYVKPLRTFLDSETGKHVNPDSEPFEVTHHHAVQLRTNGLVEFENEADEHAAVGEHGVKANKERVEQRAKLDELPANSKTTPLKNPKLKY